MVTEKRTSCPEVGQDRCRRVGFGNENVVRCDVAVGETLPMKLLERAHDRGEHRACIGQGNRAVLDQIRGTGRPVVVTVNGKPDAVLIDVATYERKLKSLNLVGLLAEGEEDIRRGRTLSASTFLKDFKRAKKVSR